MRRRASLERRERVMLRDDDTCQYCGFPADVVDHVTPFSAGGSNSLANLVASCRPCNGIAWAHTFPSFTEKRDYILSRRRPQILRSVA
jgi:5-methylcytosine-specific restriction endonuclease McrA